MSSNLPGQNLQPSYRPSLNALPLQDYAMNYWKNNGTQTEKLIVGFPTYGHTFTLSNPSQHGIGVPASGPGPAGTYTREAGFLTYYEICLFLKDGAIEVWDDYGKVPYAYKGSDWVGYDNPKSFQIKVEKITLEAPWSGQLIWMTSLGLSVTREDTP
uniref:GH18 domain-containing protein n=1 Tax=Vombatus ursinus TaxID=29139 RepID=A0A4X2K3F0_VOMUR